MSALREFFASRARVISVGAFIGVFAALFSPRIHKVDHL